MLPLEREAGSERAPLSKRQRRERRKKRLRHRRGHKAHFPAHQMDKFHAEGILRRHNKSRPEQRRTGAGMADNTVGSAKHPQLSAEVGGIYVQDELDH